MSEEKLDPKDDEQKIVNEKDTGRSWRGGSKEERNPDKYGRPSEEVEKVQGEE